MSELHAIAGFKTFWFLVKIVPIIRKTLRTIQIEFFSSENISFWCFNFQEMWSICRMQVILLNHFNHRGLCILSLYLIVLELITTLKKVLFVTVISGYRENMPKVIFSLFILFIMAFSTLLAIRPGDFFPL